ncbi:MAG TPA: cupin domain-containing protein [Pseudacidobacterium sp.]|jgi:mannose-6-phosphate isomerase-like protein (cupin superfamily)|nr:cupin domain-containing protein [Pseudacidobacterium sp.]
MTCDELRVSLHLDNPPASLPSLLQSLWWDAKGDWTRAHEIAQEIESPEAAWVHAYLHRKEGDLWNAGYWYHRAGKIQNKLPLALEWGQIASHLLQISPLSSDEIGIQSFNTSQIGDAAMDKNLLLDPGTTVLETGHGCRCFWLMGDFYAIKTTAEQTNGQYSVMEIQSFPGNGPPAHIQRREEECLYIVEGAFSVIVGDRIVDAADGDFIRIPKGVPHTYKNVGAIPGKLLIIFAPGGIEQFWAEVGQPGSVKEAPRQDDRLVFDRLTTLAPHYQMEICP